jgi:hypothetical protein
MARLIPMKTMRHIHRRIFPAQIQHSHSFFANRDTSFASQNAPTKHNPAVFF